MSTVVVPPPPPAVTPSVTPKGFIYPPSEIRSIIDKTANFVAKNGESFEQKVAQSKGDDPKFSFLRHTDPYWAYYRFKVNELTTAMKEKTVSDGANKSGTNTNPTSNESKRVTVQAKPTEIKKKKDEVVLAPLQKPDDPIFIVKRSPGLGPLDIDIIKLTAQFMARNGPDFVTGLLTRERGNPTFDFIKPNHHLHYYFKKLVDLYQICMNPPSHLIKKIEDIKNNPDSVLKRCDNRARWEKNEERKRLEEEGQDSDRLQFALIDWHDFVVVETIDFFEDETDLPAPEAGLFGQRTETEQQQQQQHVGNGNQNGYSNTEQENDMDVEMDEDDTRMDEEDNINQIREDEEEGPMLIVKSNVKRNQLGSIFQQQQQENFLISPFTGKPIPASEMEEHTRLELLNPKYKDQMEAMRAKQMGTALADSQEMAANLQAFAQTRKQILGDKAKEVEKEEEAKRKLASKKVIWDGHVDSIGMTANAAMQSTIEEQIRVMQEKANSIENSKDSIGPSLGPGSSSSSSSSSVVGSSILPPPPPLSSNYLTQPSQSQQSQQQQQQVGGIMPLGMNFTTLPMNPMTIAALQQQQQQQQMAMRNPLISPVPTPLPLAVSNSVVPLPVSLPIVGGTTVPLQTSISLETPNAKRQKLDESEQQIEISLIPEEEFAKQFPNDVLLHIKLPEDQTKSDFRLNGQTLKICVGIRDIISNLKEKIKDECGLPAQKQNLNVDNLGFLKNDKSIAFYNLRPGHLITLSVKERGGRKR